MAKLPIETKNPLFGKYLYPTAKDIMEHQQDVTWTAQEIPVDKDILGMMSGRRNKRKSWE